MVLGNLTGNCSLVERLQVLDNFLPREEVLVVMVVNAHHLELVPELNPVHPLVAALSGKMIGVIFVEEFGEP